ncbi:hypothetical protein UK23_13920 [Lentzea aerocolonigenes]|uniref:Lipoprotein n=1 Tax=Lentzea aerocolonigenes TaxID=68170 RepID=A0A0F0H0Z0_LENAE|nr:hypothetical protein [Lentzea aerocolonigenes]KJK49394.1 hypothetical protein UK23_13920 [Lentzea aerocolonigenes]
MRISLAVITIALLAAGCGGSGQENKPAAENQPTETSSSASDMPKNLLVGDWKESAGQSDKVQETLSKAGFDCSRADMDYVDLRMCVKSVPPPSAEKAGSSIRMKFLADGKGTVVRAAIDGADKEGSMRSAALKALLPEQDVAVVQAGGQTLTWGTMKEQQDTVHLVVKGGEQAADVLNPISFNTTKEQALPKMQAGGFKCEFKAPIGSTQQTSLECNMFGGGFEDIQRSASLADAGNGLSAITIKAWQGKTTDQNIAALKSMVKPAFEVSDDLKDIKAYVEKNLDGKEHSAYVGKFIVTIQISKSLMLGDSAAVNVTHETNDFGATKK